MKRNSFILLIILITIAGCGQESGESEDSRTIAAALTDRFARQFQDIDEIADLTKLTDEKRDFLAFFNDTGDRIYFDRLLEIKTVEDETDSAKKFVEQHYSIDYKTGQLYILNKQPVRPTVEYLPADSLPATPTDNPVYGLRHEGVLYFTAKAISSGKISNIYQLAGDSLTQLTYGKKTTLIQRISPDGRFLAFLYDSDKSILVVYDNTTGKYYSVPKYPGEPDQKDFAASFSPDSKFMVFIRAGNLYEKNDIPYGDIWLVKFK